ncbi:hypothetical protein MRB53_034709 [Persea americana]|uniref:Uncharacterized protein n=1 Tax=Persea americana TaxID=3435 RepID=A0ACC2K2U1_PERAE|nr:hypothetical protein MRB53_034709 [Persea americana]
MSENLSGKEEKKKEKERGGDVGRCVQENLSGKEENKKKEKERGGDAGGCVQGAGAVCAVVTSGSAGGERGVPGWCLGCLFCTWEEGGDDAAQGGGRREAEVVPTGCTEHA